MNKKILLVFSLLLSTVALAGAVSTTLLSSTNAQGTAPTAAQIQEKITQLQNEKADLVNRRTTLVRDTILNSGCLIGRENAGPTSQIVPYEDFVAVCPPSVNGQYSQEYKNLRAAILENNPILLDISGKIGDINIQLQAALELLTSALGTAAVPEPPLPESDTSTTPPPPELSNAELALLAGFDPVDAPTIIEEYFVPALDPTIRLNGPNGPVKAAVEEGVILLAEDIVLLPGEILEIPQLGLAIGNSTKLTAFMNLLRRFIPTATATAKLSPAVFCTKCDPLREAWNKAASYATYAQRDAESVTRNAEEAAADAKELEDRAVEAQKAYVQLNTFIEYTKEDGTVVRFGRGTPAEVEAARLAAEVAKNKAIALRKIANELAAKAKALQQVANEAQRVAVIAKAAYDACIKDCKSTEFALPAGANFSVLGQPEFGPYVIIADTQEIIFTLKNGLKFSVVYEVIPGGGIALSQQAYWDSEAGEWVSVSTTVNRSFRTITQSAAAITPPIAVNEQERIALLTLIRTCVESITSAVTCCPAPGGGETCIRDDSTSVANRVIACWEKFGAPLGIVR